MQNQSVYDYVTSSINIMAGNSHICAHRMFIQARTSALSHQTFCMYKMSQDMNFPTMWYVQPAKAQTSLRICAD